MPQRSYSLSRLASRPGLAGDARVADEQAAAEAAAAIIAAAARAAGGRARTVRAGAEWGPDALAGTPPEIDLVHLGLGPDGHAASLVPGDPVNRVTDRDVALTGVYQGRCRMTLTFPAINRARRVLWLVTGAERAEMLAWLRKADASIPADRVRQERAVIVANRAAVDRA